MKTIMRQPSRPYTLGFSLVEMLVAMALGLILVIAFASVYLSSRTGMRRVEQLSDIQQSVRTAFEYLTSDAHAVGVAGCQNRRGTGSINNLSATDIRTNYLIPVEGYDASSAPSYPISTASSANGNWATNVVGSGSSSAALPFTALDSTALALGSDVLVLRTAVGKPLRLTASVNPALNRFQLQVEATSESSFCADGTTAKLSGFCAGSHAMIASCTNARVFQVSSVTTSGTTTTLNISNATTGLGTDPIYQQASSEVFPLQTILYYVRPSLNGQGESLYRRLYDGDDGASGAGEEQELIRNVESLQVTYGVDTATTNADGSPDFTADRYVTADSVGDWSTVVAVRMSLLIRAREPVSAGVSAPASGVVNGVTVTYPTTGPSYDRRVFTTTVSLRNRAAF